MSKPLTEGTYNATLVVPNVAEHWFTVSEKKGTDGIVLDLRTECGTAIQTVLWLSPAAFERSLKTLREVFGLEGSITNIVKEGALKTLECSITVEMEEYKGKLYPKIKWVNKRKGSAIEAYELKGVLNRLSALEKAAGASPAKDVSDDWDVAPAKNPTRHMQQASDGMGDDSIPFARPHHLTIGAY